MQVIELYYFRYIEVFQAYNVTDLDDMPKSRPMKPLKPWSYHPDQAGYNVYDNEWASPPPHRIPPRPYHCLRMRGQLYVIVLLFGVLSIDVYSSLHIVRNAGP